MGDYGRDLAYVHDAAFLELARAATPAALGWLKGAGVEHGLVVELGCGSGETAAREAESWRSGEDWALLYRARERGHELVREIEVFRRDGRGAGYRRTRETHRLRLRPTGEITALLRECGFRVRVRRGYDERLLLPGHRVFLARRL